jgi:hypothetical protein
MRSKLKKSKTVIHQIIVVKHAAKFHGRKKKDSLRVKMLKKLLKKKRFFFIKMHQCNQCVLCFKKRLVGLYEEFSRIDRDTRRGVINKFAECIPKPVRTPEEIDEELEEHLGSKVLTRPEYHYFNGKYTRRDFE